MRDLKRYLQQTMIAPPDGGTTTIVERVETERGTVVEKVLAEDDTVVVDANPQRIIVRQTPPETSPRNDDDDDDDEDNSDKGGNPDGTATTTSNSHSHSSGSKGTTQPRPESPSLTNTASAKDEKEKQENVETPSATEESPKTPKRRKGGRVLRPKRATRVVPLADLQPTALARAPDDGPAAYILVKVAHVRGAARSYWTLAIGAACTGRDLCASIREVDTSAAPAAAPAKEGEDQEKQQQEQQKDMLLFVVGSTEAATAVFSPRDAHSGKQVSLDTDVYALAQSWEGAANRIFVVVDPNLLSPDEEAKVCTAFDPIAVPSAQEQQEQQQPQQQQQQPKQGMKSPVARSPARGGELFRGRKKAQARRSIVLDVAGTREEDRATWIPETAIEWRSKISSGTFARVYKGVYRGRVVAIKKLKGRLDEKTATEFRKELRVLKAVHGPHVVECYGVCYEHDRLSYVMEYCARGTLVHVMLDPCVALAWPNALDLFAQAVRGIHFLHCGGANAVIHRDLKSQNLLVTRDFCVKVGDFGLSRYNTVSNGTTLSTLCGTMSHCAPEVFAGERFTTKSDVYSLGVVLWELAERVATGTYTAPYKEYPFITLDIQIIVMASQKHLRPTIHPDVPGPVAALIRRCWDPDPGARPSTAQILDALAPLPQQRPTETPLLPQSPPSCPLPSQDVPPPQPE